MLQSFCRCKEQKFAVFGGPYVNKHILWVWFHLRQHWRGDVLKRDKMRRTSEDWWLGFPINWLTQYKTRVLKWYKAKPWRQKTHQVFAKFTELWYVCVCYQTILQEKSTLELCYFACWQQEVANVLQKWI